MRSVKHNHILTLVSSFDRFTQEQIQAVIDANLFPPLINMLSVAEFDIKKEAAWAISNATSGVCVVCE